MALRLISIYRPHTAAFIGFGFPIKKDGKYWKYFLDLANSIMETKADPYKFIVVQFQELGMRYPQELNSKVAWELYNLSKDIDVYDKEMELARVLLNTFNIVKDWSKISGFDKPNYSAFLKNNKNRFLLHRHDIRPELFLLTKSFYNELTKEERNEIIPKAEIKRAIIFSHKNILEKLKEVLGDEFSRDIPEDKSVQQVQSLQEQDSELLI
jgi:hypothetical protein